MKYENNAPVVANVSNWYGLEIFKIYSVSGGNQLYRNGYQQLKIRVVIAVVDWFGFQAALTQSELDSIVLTDVSSGLPLPKKDRHGPGGSNVWEYTEYEDNRFRELPPNSPVEGSIPPGPFVYIKDFFVTTNSNSPVVVRPRITRADGITFSFDEVNDLKALRLYSVPTAIYRPEQYSISRTSAPYSSPTGDIERVEVFGLELIVDQQQIEFVTGFNMGTYPRIGSSDSRYTGYYVVGYGNGRPMQTGGAMNWERPEALGRSRSENGRVALILAYGKHGGRVWVRDPAPNTPMELRDMYGNLHQLRIELSDDPLLVRVFR